MNGALDSQVIGIFAAVLMMVGGGILGLLAYQNSRKKGVERLRRVLVEDADAGEEVDPSLAATWSAMVRAAEQLGSGSGLYATLGDRLNRAGWVINASEFLLLLGGLAVGGAVLGLVVGGAVAAVGLGLVLPVATYLVLTFRADRYSRRCDGQLPDALGQMAASMRAGHSLQQSLEGIADHAPKPLAAEFRRVLSDTRVGRPLDDALLAMGERVGSADLKWTVRAMLIQRRTGGRLADILEVLAEFMRDRVEVRREVSALTAEGKISAVILMGLPFVVLGGVLATNPTYLQPLFTEPLGRLMLLGAAGSMGVAWLLMRNIIKVEV
ncbi:MAG: type II secretion system F family protein [Euzebya sp.]